MSDIEKILLVDDEKAILTTFSMILADMGFYVKTACQAETALEIVASEKFELVFLDQFLDTTTGLELMDEMAKIDPNLYFVIFTANGSCDLAVESLKKGASDFISKPFFACDLLRSINYVQQKRELNVQKKQMMLELEGKVDEKTGELQSIHLSVLASLAQAIEKKDTGTFGHGRRVSYISMLIAKNLGINQQEQDTLRIAALLHDIGKIGISDYLLGKRGALTREEMNEIRCHPKNGFEILKPVKHFKNILPAILHHHESYNGSGYPHGLSGEEIPLHARIISVADTYDAIISDRPYRSASTHTAAVEELRRCAGRQFDAGIVRAFTDIGMIGLFNCT